MKNTGHIEKNASTEEKIKEAAKRVFTQKGFAATRTRDIAEESGFNLALINYYFRSKEKLFDIIMLEHLQTFRDGVLGVLNEETTSLRQKMEILVERYIDMLIANPDLPLFVLNEINVDPNKFISKMGVDHAAHRKLYIVKQFEEMISVQKKPFMNPVHILMNFVSITIFPFIGSPMIRNRTGLSMEQFNGLMQERKKLIPVWIEAMITGNQTNVVVDNEP